MKSRSRPNGSNAWSAERRLIALLTYNVALSEATVTKHDETNVGSILPSIHLNNSSEEGPRMFSKRSTRVREIRSIIAIATFALGVVSDAIAQPTAQGRVTVELLAPLPQGVAGHAVGLVENTLISVGGTSWSDDRQTKKWHDDCYVKEGEIWTKGTSLPHPRADSASAFDSHGMYMIGGMDRMTESSSVYQLSSLKGSWNQLPSLPKTIQGASAVAIDHFLIVVGGKSENRPQVETWVFDRSEKNPSWSPRAKFPGPGRSHSAIVAINRTVYLLGGFVLDEAGNLQIFDDAYRYDVKLDHWEKLWHIHVPGYAWSACPLTDTKLIIAGRVRARGDIRTDIELLDLTDASIQTIGHLQVPTCVAPMIHVGKGQWVVIGGEPDPNRNRNNAVQLLTYEPLRK